MPESRQWTKAAKSFVSDVREGDLWLFPKGVPHSIQGLGPDGCRFLLVFDDGSFNEFETFLITDWMVHTPQKYSRRKLQRAGVRLQATFRRESYSSFRLICRAI